MPFESAEAALAAGKTQVEIDAWGAAHRTIPIASAMEIGKINVAKMVEAMVAGREAAGWKNNYGPDVKNAGATENRAKAEKKAKAKIFAEQFDKAKILAGWKKDYGAMATKVVADGNRKKAIGIATVHVDQIKDLFKKFDKLKVEKGWKESYGAMTSGAKGAAKREKAEQAAKQALLGSM